MSAPLSPSGLPTVDARWGGLADGGAYLLIGRASAGRSALALSCAAATVTAGGTTLLISPRSPDELAAAGAPSGVDIRALHATGRLRLLRTPSAADLAARGSDGLDAAYRDLTALIASERPARVVMEDFTPLVQFDSFDRFRAALGTLVSTLRDAGVTLLVGLGEPANEASEHLIALVREAVDATVTLVVDGETRRLDLARRDAAAAPAPEAAVSEPPAAEPAFETPSPEVPAPAAEAPAAPAGGDSSAPAESFAPSPAPPPALTSALPPTTEAPPTAVPRAIPETRIAPPPPADPSLLEPAGDTFGQDPTVQMFEQGYLVDSGASGVVGHIPPAESAFPFPPSPAGFDPPAGFAPPFAPPAVPPPASPTANPAAEMRETLDAAFAARDGGTPFLVVAVRMEAAAPEGAHFFAVADGLRRGLRPVDRLLVDLPRRRAVVALPGVGAEGAAALFASLQAHLRSTLGPEAEAVLRAVGAVSVPDGQPFTSTADLMAYAFDS
ncbi:MAG TPA: ATPase domain-containing protein [Rubricoccaceae bacterium]